MSERHRYYVITDKKDDPVAVALEKDLSARGSSVSTGLDWAIPADAEVKVLFTANWARDVTPFLKELKIEMIDVRSGAALASGQSDRTSISRKGVGQMVKEVDDRIFSRASSE